MALSEGLTGVMYAIAWQLEAMWVGDPGIFGSEALEARGKGRRSGWMGSGSGRWWGRVMEWIDEAGEGPICQKDYDRRPSQRHSPTTGGYQIA